MVRCPFLPGLQFTDSDTLKSLLIDTANLHNLWEHLQTLVSEDRFLEIQMHLLDSRGRDVREDKLRLVDIYVSELFAQEQRDSERPWRSDMKRRPEEESGVSISSLNANAPRERAGASRNAGCNTCREDGGGAETRTGTQGEGGSRAVNGNELTS